MKKIIFILALFAGSTALAQDVINTDVASVETIKSQPTHMPGCKGELGHSSCGQDSMPRALSRDLLMSKGKLSLTEIYIAQISQIVMMLPPSAFNSQNMDQDVPNNKFVKARKHKVYLATLDYNENLVKQYRDIIPYTDKKELVEQILYLQEVMMNL